MNRLSLVEDWVDLAMSDLKAVSKLSIFENRGAVVFHLQQCTEKILKAIMAALGFDPPKTHFPSRKLEEILVDIELGNLELDISPGIRTRIERIINIARSIEDEVTRPRYGIRHVDRIIHPDDLYSTDIIKLFLNDVRYILNETLNLFRELNICKRQSSICEKLMEGQSYAPKGAK